MKDTDMHGKDHKVKQYTIIINGREITVNDHKLTFMQIIELAYNPVPTGQYIYFTVTYRKAHGNSPEGSLTEGEEITIRDGIIFNVTATDKS